MLEESSTFEKACFYLDTMRTPMQKGWVPFQLRSHHNLHFCYAACMGVNLL